MSLKEKVISGSFWTTLSFGTQSFIQILRLSILTRFLEKSDFGLVAIVTLVLGFTHIFADLEFLCRYIHGISSQKKNIVVYTG